MCEIWGMATNLAIDPELLATAHRLSGQKSKKAAVTLALKEFVARRWLEENKDAIASYNEDVRENGVWSDGLRGW